MISAVTKSVEDTLAFGMAFSKVLMPGDVVLLMGDMGAGKTTFVKGVGVGLGVAEPITSPTFVLLHTYSGRIPLHHADLYRLERFEEVVDTGIMELIDDGVAFIEWADRGLSAFPTDVLRIQFSYDEQDENTRRFDLQGTGKVWAERADALIDELQQWVVEQ